MQLRWAWWLEVNAVEIGVETDVEIGIETSVWWVWWCCDGGRFLGLVAGIWLVGLLWVCWVCSGYLVGFILFFYFFYFWFLVPVGFCWAEGSGGRCYRLREKEKKRKRKKIVKKGIKKNI